LNSKAVEFVLEGGQELSESLELSIIECRLRLVSGLFDRHVCDQLLDLLFKDRNTLFKVLEVVRDVSLNSSTVTFDFESESFNHSFEILLELLVTFFSELLDIN
jgi:hypothetical protein